jgi:hypothetical protein
MSELVKSMMDEDHDDDDDDGAGSSPEIPLPNVKSEVLKKVIEFCEHHLGDPMTEIEKPLKSQNMADVVQKWYADFVDLEQVLLFELILAANYMDIKPLLDLTCATVASMIKGKTVRTKAGRGLLPMWRVARTRVRKGCFIWCLFQLYFLCLTNPGFFLFGLSLSSSSFLCCCCWCPSPAARRDPRHLQHHQRLLTRRRGPSAGGKQMVRRGLTPKVARGEWILVSKHDNAQ